jgi:hypothetical protein
MRNLFTNSVAHARVNIVNNLNKDNTMTKKQTTTKPAATKDAAPKVSFVERSKAVALGAVNFTAKVLTIVDIAARISLGVAVWFIAVPQFVIYAATFLGVVGLLQCGHMLWKAQQ